MLNHTVIEQSRAMVEWGDFAISDEVAGTIAPIAVYWIYGGMYHLLPPLDRYRLHTRKEEDQKNLVPKSTVIKGVLFQQAVQAVVSLLLFMLTSQPNEQVVQPNLLKQIGQIIVAMVVMDTWQYFVHRYMHINKFLYRNLHARHHQLVVPYAYGALYNHPVEGLLMDTVGGVISFLVSGMTPRMSIFFFSFATIKTVDDHCGLCLPWNPFHWLFQNNSAYHDVHHQLYGTKFNFSQPFFNVWDKILGTHMPYSLEKRAEGGYEARPVKKVA